MQLPSFISIYIYSHKPETELPLFNIKEIYKRSNTISCIFKCSRHNIKAYAQELDSNIIE